MPRPPRFDAPGSLHHVMGLGIDGKKIFINRANFKTPTFTQCLRHAQILILEIFNIFLWLKFSPSLTLSKIERFETGSLERKIKIFRTSSRSLLSGCPERLSLALFCNQRNIFKSFWKQPILLHLLYCYDWPIPENAPIGYLSIKVSIGGNEIFRKKSFYKRKVETAAQENNSIIQLKVVKEKRMRILISLVWIFILVMFVIGCATKDPSPPLKNTGSSPEITENHNKPKSSETESTEPEPIVLKPRAKVTAHRLNMRDGASTKSRILGVLKKGDLIEILSQKGKWVQVHNEIGLSGWVSGRYIKPIDSMVIAKAKDVKKPEKRSKPQRKKVMESKKASSATTVKRASAYNKSIFKTPINKAIEKMLLASGDYEILGTATSISSNILEDFATADIVCKQNGKKTKLKIYLYKKNDQWVAYKEIPTHLDHRGVFFMLARQYCADKWEHFNGIGYLDESWKNKDPRMRTINFNCMELENNEWKDNHLRLTYEYDKQKGWQITEAHELQTVAQNAKQTGGIAQTETSSNVPKKTPSQPEEMEFSDQVTDRFFQSILGGDMEAVKGFLDAGMSPNVKRPRFGHSPLFTAVMGHRDKIALMLIKKGSDVNFKDINQSTPLMWAARNCRSIPLVQALVNAGADVNAKAKGGGTPLMSAKVNHCKEIVRILNEGGAK